MTSFLQLKTIFSREIHEGGYNQFTEPLVYTFSQTPINRRHFRTFVFTTFSISRLRCTRGASTGFSRVDGEKTHTPTLSPRDITWGRRLSDVSTETKPITHL